MTLRLTPDMVCASYELLRTTPPFRRWGLPDGCLVRFLVFRSALKRGDYGFENGKHVIRISARNHAQLGWTLMTVAHEVLHMRQKMLGLPLTHGADFQRLARQICRHHGFDQNAF